MKNDPQNPEKFSDNPEEQLRIENELLKLKLKAETGSDIQHGNREPDPVLENAFLKNVIEFERRYAKAKETTVFDLIGKPAFPEEKTLRDEQVPEALENVNRVLHQFHIEVDFIADYPDREKYRFITEELFSHETDDMMIPGMTQHFIYEEFHPNHPLTIADRATDFIRSWFRQDFSADSMELADQWITDEGQIYPKAYLLEKMQQIFDAYDHFENTKYEILDVHSDVREGEDTGMGYAEGLVKYDAVMENGESMHYEGPFKLYLELRDEWWSILFAYWPGLEI